MARIFFTILTLVFFYRNSFNAQNSSQDSIKVHFNPEYNIYSGFIIKNYPNVPKELMANFISVNFSFQTSGRRNWQGFYKFPKIGIETVFGFFNNSQLGYAVGVVPNMEFRNKKKYFLKIGFGAAYFSNPFNLISNNKNFYIGYPFDNMTILSFGHISKLGKKCALLYGISSIHSSDGHTSLPNAGMNCVLFNIGLISGRDHKPNVLTPVKDTIKSKFILSVRASLGMHEFGETTKAIGGPSYPSYHSALYISRPYKKIHVVEAGIIWSYYTSFHDYIINQEMYKDKINLRSCTGVIFIGHEFVFGKFGFSTQAGFYFYNPFFIQQKKLDGSWKEVSQKMEAFNTNRVGFMYYPFKKKSTLNRLKNQFMLGMYIKANLGQADLLEFCVGYRF